MLSEEFMTEYASSRANEPANNLYWLTSSMMGQEEEVYCFQCATSKKKEGQFVDGGWLWESDSRRWCEECRKELRVSPTDYAANDELSYFRDHGMPKDKEDWWCLSWAMRAFSPNDPRWDLVRQLFAEWGINPGRA